MISIQRLLGRPREFFGLLESSASLSIQSIAELKAILARPDGPPDLTALRNARRKGKEVMNRLEELLTRVFVTPIEREDLEALGERLYRLPKTLEKFAERYEIVYDKVRGRDFSLLVGMLARAASIVQEMVTRVGQGDNGALAGVKALDARLSQIEQEASHLILDATRQLYSAPAPALEAIVCKELNDILGDCIECCRDIGRTAALVILKNS
jgi:uncharacterized protein Yka (UPF0111/DUF47 family)